MPSPYILMSSSPSYGPFPRPSRAFSVAILCWIISRRFSKERLMNSTFPSMLATSWSVGSRSGIGCPPCCSEAILLYASAKLQTVLDVHTNCCIRQLRRKRYFEPRETDLIETILVTPRLKMPIQSVGIISIPMHPIIFIAV